MAVETRVIPRAKDFKYRVEFNGLPVALVQKFSPGKRTHGITHHAGAGQNFPSKEVGMITYEPCTLELVVPIEGDGVDFFETWMNQGQDPETGNGGMPSQYQRNFSVLELKPDGTPFRVWEFYRAQPVTDDPGKHDSLAKDKDLLEEVHIEYEWRKLRNLAA
jgi:hypothetical protein